MTVLAKNYDYKSVLVAISESLLHLDSSIFFNIFPSRHVLGRPIRQVNVFTIGSIGFAKDIVSVVIFRVPNCDEGIIELLIVVGLLAFPGRPTTVDIAVDIGLISGLFPT